MAKPRRLLTPGETTTTPLTDKLFATKLAENRVIYDPFDTKPPDDARELIVALLEEQDIPTWAHRNWENIKILERQGTEDDLSLESMIAESMLSHHGNNAPLGYSRFRNQQWTGIDNEITAGISDPKPDVTEAYVWSVYHRDTKKEFDELVISQYTYAMPTFAMESKGALADPDQAVRQAAYVGALMTHAATAIDHRVGKDFMQFRKTKAITATLSTSEINIYANHAVKEPPESHKIFYHQYLLMTVRHNISEEKWNEAHKVLYNAQRLALELANARIYDTREYFERKDVI